MGHLIDAGRQFALGDTDDAAGKPKWLVLMVHRDNARAIRFYEQCGFEVIPNVVRRNDHLVMKLWIGE
jgi:ribosomal protein S18 acetylase RimI-like enzyme